MSLMLTDCKIMLGGYNLSGYHNSMNLEYGAEMLDDTVFGTNGTRSNKPGLKTVSMTGNIFWDTTQDGINYNRIGAVREVMSWAHLGNSEGDTVFTTRGVNANYNPLSGAVGELMASEFDAMAANTPLVRGKLLATGSKAASGNGGGILVGAVSATQKVYSALHVLAIAATSIIVEVESDDAVGFASPTSQITHTTFLGAGTVGAEWMELAGPITDTYWRSKWTIVGGPFTIFHSVGIK